MSDYLCFTRSDSPSYTCIYRCADNHYCSIVCGHLCYVQTPEDSYSSVGFYTCFILLLQCHAAEIIMKQSISVIMFLSALLAANTCVIHEYVEQSLSNCSITSLNSSWLAIIKAWKIIYQLESQICCLSRK